MEGMPGNISDSVVVETSPAPVASIPAPTAPGGGTIQVLLVIPVLFIFVVIFFGFTGSRGVKRRKDIKDIRSRTVGRDADMHVNPNLINAKILDAIVRETLRCAELRETFDPDPTNPKPSGWGAMPLGGEASAPYIGDLKQSIARSINQLHRRFVDQSPGTAVDVDRIPPRELLSILMANYPNLEFGVLRQYLRMYEFSRFGRSEVPELAHSKFVRKLFNMLTLIDTRHDAEEDA